MSIFGWINVAFGVAAALAGIIVLRGVFRCALSSASTVRFFNLSLVASLAGLLPMAHHLTPVQQICMASVYCSAAAIVAWLKFGLMGRWRRIFAVSVTAILYFDLIFVFTWLFKKAPLFTGPLAEPILPYQFAQISFATLFIVLGILAANRCRIEPAGVSGLGKVKQII